MLACRVLVLEPLHSKCLYRRAAAHHQLHHFDEARQYLGQLLEAEPGNAAARKELQEVGKSEKEYNARQRKRYGGMFGKEGSDLYGDKEEERLRRERKAREREVRRLCSIMLARVPTYLPSLAGLPDGPIYAGQNRAPRQRPRRDSL